jgi:hypothetical protein
MQYQFMIRQFRYGIIYTRIPQKPTLRVVDEVAVSGKADGNADVGAWRPPGFVGTTAVAAIDHIKPVDSRFLLRIGRSRNSRAGDGDRKRQDGNLEGALGSHFL